MTRNQATSVGLFVAGLGGTLAAFAALFWGFALPWGTALAVAGLAGFVGVFGAWLESGPSTQSSEPDASGSVDRNPTTAGPVTNGDAPEAEGLAGGGVEVAMVELRKEAPRHG